MLSNQGSSHIRRMPNGGQTPKIYDTFSGKPDDVSAESGPVKGFTIQEAIDHIGFGWKQVQIGVVSSFCLLSDGLEIYMLSIIAPELLCRWQLSKGEEATITTVVFIGMFIGSSLLGFLSDIYGRKKGLVLTAAWVFYYGFLSALSPNYAWILILRCLVGVGISGVAFSTPYYVEFLPVNKRGRLTILPWAMVSLGSATANVLAIFIMPYGWRPWVAALSLPSLIFVLLSFSLPTSPRFELACGRKEVAYGILEDLAKSNGKELPPGELVSEAVAERGRIQNLFKPDLRLTSTLLAFIWFCISFAFYGILLFTSELVKVGSTCQPALNEQLTCNAECKTLDTYGYLILLGNSIAEVIGTFVNAMFTDIIGRKKIMILQSSLLGIGCFLLCICMNRVPMVILLTFVRVIACTLYQTIYLYTAEVYPTEVRALAVGCGASFGRIGGITTPYCAQVLLGWSVHAGLSVYGGISLLCSLAVFLLPIETKGRHIV